MYKGHSIKLADDFSSSAMKSKRQCDDVFKAWKSIIPYSAKLFFKNESTCSDISYQDIFGRSKS